MLAHLDRWDAVTGWRVNRAAGDSWIRRLSSRVANRVRNASSEETIQDSGCTFRAFRRECSAGSGAVPGLSPLHPHPAQDAGFRVLEVPVNHRPRRFGTSKYGIGNRALRAFVDLLVGPLDEGPPASLRGDRGSGGGRPDAAVKVLLVGLGRWGERHLRVLGELGVELWVADLSEERRAFAVRAGVAPARAITDFRHRPPPRRRRRCGHPGRQPSGAG